MGVEILLGNDAIALGLVEQGCRVVTAYPGTPSSEILAGVVRFDKQFDRGIYTEWSTNEKVAFEVALAASWAGLRAAVAMKQVGLNVAADPLFSAAYTGVRGGFLVIAADDPGPHSSQTEQDSRLMALNAKVPVLDPSSPSEARAAVEYGLQLSEKWALPVLLRPTTRLCHALQNLELPEDLPTLAQPERVRFRKEPARWAATPRRRYFLHQEMDEKLREIAWQFERSSLNRIVNAGSSDKLGVIASGVAFHTVVQALSQLGVRVPVLKLGTPFPLPEAMVSSFMSSVDTVLVVEEPDACIELQLPRRTEVRGRRDGTVPAAGELVPEQVAAILDELLRAARFDVRPFAADAHLQGMVEQLELPGRPPRLCPGCGHRSAFYAVKQEFGARAIYPGDIGCYTLGINQRAVDTVLDMGASVTMATGLYQANRLLDDGRPIVASIGDSTFLHSGVPALINAVHTGARFVLLILDNHTTAMTGFQPTAATERLSDGSQATSRVSFSQLVQACGVTFVREVDPYDGEPFRKVLRAAYEHSQAPEGGVAVVIANRPCVLFDPSPVRADPRPVLITEDCDGCRYCLEVFDCPALVLRDDGSRVDVDEKVCIECGQCVDACYKGFIQWQLSF